MNIDVLIHSIVRQVTVLIAQLATSGGVRAPLAQVANQVFLELAKELEAQGLSRKVSADMFGMALRAYIRKVRRLTESATDGELTLWQATLAFIKAEGLVTRERMLSRFHRDGELEVSSILKDLADNGLVFVSGSGQGSVYRAASDEELSQISALAVSSGLEELAWVLIFRHGPLPMQRLGGLLSVGDNEVDSVVDALVTSGRVQRTGDVLSAKEFVIPLGSSRGWEASVFDHIQAVVQTICQRLQEAGQGGAPSGCAGGSTYTFDVWPGHPNYDEVRGLLSEQRERLGKLRESVEQHNRDQGRAESFEAVVAYVGQAFRAGGGENEVGISSVPGADEGASRVEQQAGRGSDESEAQ